MSYPRTYPCMTCGTPKSATRSKSRCRKCSYAHVLERHRELRRNPKPEPKPRVVRVIASTDDDIQRYRREKAKREGREDATIADARRLFLLLEAGMKPKRGRPRQDFGRKAAAA